MLAELLEQYPPEALHAAVRRQLCTISFREFFRDAWKIVEPSRPLVDNWHVHALCDHLEAVARGEIRRLIINVPPGYLKSIAGPVMLPAWIWTWNPAYRSIWTSYAGPLASRDSHRCRLILESEWYVENFSGPAGWVFDPRQNEKTHYENTARGFRMSFGVGTGTGYRANLVGADDPINAYDAYSKLERDKVILWWDETMSSRLIDPLVDSFLVIMQRLHVDDLSGHLLRQGGYEHLCIPLEFDRKRAFVTFREVELQAGERGREVFQEDPRQEDGELIYPPAAPPQVIAESIAKLGTSGHAAQKNQDPSPAGGDFFAMSWFRFFLFPGTDRTQLAPRPRDCFQGPPIEVDLEAIDEWLISCDCKHKNITHGSFVSLGVWFRIKEDYFRVARRRFRGGLKRTVQELLELCELWPQARKKLVEPKAQGPDVMEVLEREVAGLIGREPKGSKESRANAVSPTVESGHVYLLDGAPWIEEFARECAGFPKGNDDQVDEMTQALLEWSASSAARRASDLCNIRNWQSGLVKMAAT